MRLWGHSMKKLEFGLGFKTRMELDKLKWQGGHFGRNSQREI